MAPGLHTAGQEPQRTPRRSRFPIVRTRSHAHPHAARLSRPLRVVQLLTIVLQILARYLKPIRQFFLEQQREQYSQDQVILYKTVNPQARLCLAFLPECVHGTHCFLLIRFGEGDGIGSPRATAGDHDRTVLVDNAAMLCAEAIDLMIQHLHVLGALHPMQSRWQFACYPKDQTQWGMDLLFEREYLHCHAGDAEVLDAWLWDELPQWPKRHVAIVDPANIIFLRAFLSLSPCWRDCLRPLVPEGLREERILMV
ncbi:MAG: hypothetical protein HW412_645 [Bacteroidetes bacterium]|nr:hypothetical protein [Bacteroidota bacterium]